MSTDVQQVGTLPDGRLVGVDSKGNLYAGTPRQAGFDELEREVVDNGDGTWSSFYKVGLHLHGKGLTDHDPRRGVDGSELLYRPAKRFATVVLDGKTVTVEQTVTVVDWTKLPSASVPEVK